MSTSNSHFRKFVIPDLSRTAACRILRLRSGNLIEVVNKRPEIPAPEFRISASWRYSTRVGDDKIKYFFQKELYNVNAFKN